MLLLQRGPEVRVVRPPLDADRDRILCLHSSDASLSVCLPLCLSFLSTVRPPSPPFLSAPVAVSSLTSHCVFILFCQREAPNTRTTLYHELCTCLWVVPCGLRLTSAHMWGKPGRGDINVRKRQFELYTWWHPILVAGLSSFSLVCRRTNYTSSHEVVLFV